MDALIAPIPAALYEQLRRQSAQARADIARRFHAGEKITEGQRRPTIFRIARANIERGVPEELVGELMLALNEARCDPPLNRDEVLSQVRGAVRWAPKPDDADVELHRQAEEFLREFEQGKAEPPPRAEIGKPATSRRAVVRRRIRDIAAERIELLPGTPIPVGGPTSVVGIGGLGKSALALAWGKRVTDHGGSVLVVSYEDAAGAVIRPRFEALGGDLDLLFVLSVDPGDGELTFPADLPEIDRHVRETGARLLIVDPVSAAIDLKLDTHRDQDVRSVLGRLTKLAERERFASLLVGHLNKAPTSDVYLRVGGSGAFFNASRLVVTVTPDPLDPDWQRLVVGHKSNYSLVPDPERWRVVVKAVNSPTGPVDVMTLEFVEVAADVRREDVLAPPASAEKRSEAEALILAELAQGRRLSAEVKAVGANAGISDRTMKRAAAELEVVVEEETTPAGRVTFWSLPAQFEGRAIPHIPHAGPTPPESHSYAEKGGRARGSGHDVETGSDPTPRPGDFG